MKIIGLDSSGLVAGVAIVEDGCLLAEYSTNYKKTHSQTLLPMLEELKDMIDLDLSTVDGVALASGPGSYTGLRIGSATAKGLGLSLDIPIVEVPTLEGLAMNLWGTDRLVCPLMDARRAQVYTGIYRFEEDAAGQMQLSTVMEQGAIPVEQVIETINGLGEKVIFLGDGVPVYDELLREKVKVPFLYAPAHLNRQRAGSIATLGSMKFAAGEYVSADDHAPEYLRKSQAENEGPQSFVI